MFRLMLTEPEYELVLAALDSVDVEMNAEIDTLESLTKKLIQAAYLHDHLASVEPEDSND